MLHKPPSVDESIRPQQRLLTSLKMYLFHFFGAFSIDSTKFTQDLCFGRKFLKKPTASVFLASTHYADTNPVPPNTFLSLLVACRVLFHINLLFVCRDQFFLQNLMRRFLLNYCVIQNCQTTKDLRCR